MVCFFVYVYSCRSVAAPTAMAVLMTARGPMWLLFAAALPFLLMFAIRPVRSGKNLTTLAITFRSHGAHKI
jgi:uncharacterized protein (DUF983 family)